MTKMADSCQNIRDEAWFLFDLLCKRNVEMNAMCEPIIKNVKWKMLWAQVKNHT